MTKEEVAEVETRCRRNSLRPVSRREEKEDHGAVHMREITSNKLEPHLRKKGELRERTCSRCGVSDTWLRCPRCLYLRPPSDNERSLFACWHNRWKGWAAGPRETRGEVGRAGETNGPPRLYDDGHMLRHSPRLLGGGGWVEVSKTTSRARGDEIVYTTE
ncbi:hypothetical protein Bbelb_207630 [Branchiostoma belcheri]|nr:hypothetical protein Bbelb_207630 [Branchiostoma belcheri]